MNIVLFLGAGFSAPFGMPTMNQFSQAVAVNKKLAARDRALYGTLLLDARRANSFLESSPTNLEDILSFFVMSDRLHDFEDGLSIPSTEVKSIIAKIYSTIKNPDSYWDDLENLNRFLQVGIADLLRDQDRISIITTNYDLIIDSFLFSQELYAEFPFDYDTTSDGNGRSLYADGHIPLFKLHGSINWFEQANSSNGRLLLEDRIIENPDNRSNEIPASYTNHSYSGGYPIIIPPSFLKPELSPQLLKNWAGASKAMKDAEFIIFIGYSFPKTDVEMKYFFANSLAENTVLQKIKIFDKYASDIVKRLKDGESGYGSHFKDFLQPIDGNWIKQRIGISRNDSGELEFG